MRNFIYFKSKSILFLGAVTLFALPIASHAACGPVIYNTSNSTYTATVTETIDGTPYFKHTQGIAGNGGTYNFKIGKPVSPNVSYTLTLAGDNQTETWSFDASSYCYIHHDGDTGKFVLNTPHDGHVKINN